MTVLLTGADMNLDNNGLERIGNDFIDSGDAKRP